LFGSGIGGNGTTRKAISVGVPALNENPEPYDELRDDPSLILSFFDKVIRWQTPLARMRRTDPGKPVRTALDADLAAFTHAVERELGSRPWAKSVFGS